jgi:hypothetical protein
MKLARAGLLVVSLPVVLASSVARAAPQVWPFLFDPSLDANPTAISTQLATGGASLPPLPLSELTKLTTDSGTMSLWLWPQNADLLTAVGSATSTLMVWPTTPVMCAKHAAFTMPTLTTTGTSCTSAATQITQAITPNLPACSLTEQPELYVLSYSPSDVSSDVGNIEDMIGLAGEAISHAGPPPAGILPPTFVPTLRSVIAKIRYPKLSASLTAASAGYAQAQTLLTTNASCFDPAVKSALAASLTDLSTEVATANTYLSNLESTGEAAAKQEGVCLAAQARERNTLPYPGLTASDREFVAFWLGATYWRMRGGGLIPLGSTQEARLYYADDGFSQIASLLAGSDGPPNVGTQFFEELVVDGWASWQSMGTNGSSDDKYADLISMSERGQRQVNASVTAFNSLGYDSGELLTGALQMGPGYYYGYYPLAAFRYAPSMASPYSGFIDATTAIGEFSIGGALGVGLAKTLLPGKPTGEAAVPLCTGRECGDDGCGGSCGSCEGGDVCNASGQCGVLEADGGIVVTGPSGADASTTRDDAGAQTSNGGSPETDTSGCACDLTRSGRSTSGLSFFGAAIGGLP